MTEDQIILIDKPAGISSFGVVAKVRGKLRADFGKKIKVGHTGTLDPFATGLLILLTGKMTKKSSEFLKLDKTYEATLKLGYTSTTGDPEGEITKFAKIEKRISEHAKEGSEGSFGGCCRERSGASPVKTGASDHVPEEPSLRVLEFVLNSFTGKITQTPPKFSAIKVNGQRAYKLARQNQDFEIPSREVEIYSIEILEYNYPELKIRVHCSSGTYIRTLAEDIGEKLGLGAYLTALRRTEVGSYSIQNATPLTDFTSPTQPKSML